MVMADALLPEFDHEMATTRKLLERVPDDKFAWQPHQKSMTMGRLAAHVADIPSWVGETLTKDVLELGPDYAPAVPQTRSDVLAWFDKMVSAARPLIAAAPDALLMTPWTLKYKGEVVMTLPKAAVLRSFVFSHLIHHRGQLSVYLRLNDLPVPAIYGPSADER